MRIIQWPIFIAALLMNHVVWAETSDTNFLEEELDISFYATSYSDNCAVCHGDSLQGAPQGTPLVGVPLKHGDSVDEIVASINNGFPQQGMPAWSQTMSEETIRNIALYVAEHRENLNYGDFNYNAELILPDGVIDTELHDFIIEPVITGLDPLPFSITPAARWQHHSGREKVRHEHYFT